MSIFKKKALSSAITMCFCRKGESRRFGHLVQRALVGCAPVKSCEGFQGLDASCQVNLAHFEDLLNEIDNTLRALPATGQVLLLLQSQHNHNLCE